MQYDNLPKELRENGKFCFWKFEKQKGQKKPAKVPYQISGKRAQPNNIKTFTNYITAIDGVSQNDGIGLGIFNNFSGIDIDHCINEDGTLTPTAKTIVDLFDGCYIEKSPSSTGLHIYFKASGFNYDIRKYYVNNQSIGVEVYVYEATNRFLTVTGNVYRDGDILEAGGKLQILLDKFMLKPVKPKHKNQKPAISYISDEEVLSRAKVAKNSESFNRLWNGEIPEGKSHSEADLALCGHLAFWCGKELCQMDRLFRQSGLYREKWDRAQSGTTYGQITLEKAADNVSETYNPIGRLVQIESEFEVPGCKPLDELNPHRNPRYGRNDIGNSNLFADHYSSIARYVPERKQWFIYDGKAWRSDTGNLKVMNLCKKLANKLMVYALSIEEELLRKQYIESVGKWQMRRQREVILKDAQDVHPLSISAFDADIYLLNCQNGTLNLQTGEFHEHRSEDYITKIAGVYYDPKVKCPRWEQFIDEVMSGDREKAEFFQKSLGYALTGDTRFEAMFILFGATTRNGKGTSMETFLRICGDYGRTCRPETIGMKSNNSGSAPSEDVARLAGARFVNISEPDKRLTLSAALLKTLTGSDTINARFLHENSFDFKPQFKIFTNTNYLPTVTDLTLLTSGRVKIIPFERHFDEFERDLGLKGEFSRQENLSGILNWALEGYAKLQKSGLDMPQSVKDATLAYHKENDKVGLFFEECLVEDGSCEERTADIYYAYQGWCRDNGYYPENARNFKAALSNMGRIVRKRPRGGGEKTTVFIGYKLLRGTEFLD